MGKLIEQSIKTLYQGVSRQPDALRLTGQVEEATNVLTSVITGGVESRAASRFVAKHTFADTADKPYVYSYVRDQAEQYIVVIKSGDLAVYDLAGAQQTVTFPDGKAYLTSSDPENEFTAITLGDITVIGNRTTVVGMVENSFSDATPQALVTCRSTTDGTNALIIDNLADSTTDGVEVWSKNGAFSGQQIADSVQSTMVFTGFAAAFRNFTKVQIPSSLDLTVLITNTAGNEFSIADNGSDPAFGVVASRKLVAVPDSDVHVITAATNASPVVVTTQNAHSYQSFQRVVINDAVGMTELNGNKYYVKRLSSTTFSLYTDYDLTTPLDGTGFGVYTEGGGVQVVEVYADTRTSRGLLPNNAPDGYKMFISATDQTDGFWVAYDIKQNAWIEAPHPYQNNEFDLTTMPHFLTRNADGTFTFSVGAFSGRSAGDTVTTPNPDFVGLKIQRIMAHRNRLAFVAGEVVYFSRSREFFEFWPEFSTQVLDSNPFGLQATSDEVNQLIHAFPFRKALFLSSDRSQFEVSSGDLLFSIKNAVVDAATAYITEPKCSPVAMGNSMYFAAKSGKDAMIFEYTYDDASLSTVAEDVTIHALGYIPAPVVRIATDSANEMAFVLSDADRSSLYLYKTFTEQERKAQSSWSKWTFGSGTTHIHWMQVIFGILYIYVTRDSETFLEKIELRYELSDDKHPYQVCLDQLSNIIGVYDGGTNTTTWTTPYNHGNTAVVVLSTDFGAGLVGERLTVTYPSTTTVSAFGDYDGGLAIVGKPFTQEVKLSKLFVRADAEGRLSIQTGRLQLKRLQFNYKDTGFFRVQITPDSRDTQIFTFNGRLIGSGSNIVGGTNIVDSGVFKVPIRTRASTAAIQITNDSEKPMIITSIDYVGFFNELTRQE